MDTKTLVVGQDVYILSGVYIRKGEVVKVTPVGVDVQELGGHRLYHFDNDGKGGDGNETYECGPWYLDDIPFAERTALFEQAARDYEARRSEANRCPPR